MKQLITQIKRNWRKTLLFSGALAMLSCDTLEAQIITIGSGTVDYVTYNPVSVGGFGFGSRPAPKNVHIQMIYTADEMHAAGITGPAMLDSIAWDVASLPAKALKNYTVKAKNHVDSLFTSFVSNDLTTVTTLPTYMPVTGWSWVRFQTPFYWNGADNLLLDICTDTVGASSPSGRIRSTELGNGFDPVNAWWSTQGPNPLCGIYTGGGGLSVKANIKMAFSAPPACSGTPITGIITPTAESGCLGISRLLQLTNRPQNAVKVQWEQAVNGGAWTNVPGNGNGTGYYALIVPNAQYINYRVVMTCTASGATSTSNVATVTKDKDPFYAALPYTQDFESWISKCDNSEIPDTSWRAWPTTGVMSWRREDQGATANWTEDVTPEYYAPASTTGAHSARFQSSKGPGVGALELYINCNTPGDKKEVRFDYFNKTLSNNFLDVKVSTDGGMTFTSLAVLDNQGVNAQWQSQVVPFSSASAQTVIRFEGNSDGMQSGDFDLGIDNVRVYPSCSEAPVAGTFVL